MIYLADITTPPNTPKSSPLRTDVRITKGLVYRVEFVFPPGSAGLLHVWVKDGGVRLWPTGEDKDFRGDNCQITFDDVYLKTQPPYLFSFYTYNLDDLYEHNVICRIGLVSSEIFVARFLPTQAYDYFMRLLNAAEEKSKRETEEERQSTIDNPFPWTVDGEE